MDYYVGLDVSLRSVAVCVVDADGKHVFESTVECEIEDIVRCLEDLPVSTMRIGFESGAMSQHLYYGLRSAGFDVVCMEARQVNAALSAMRNKTDRTDARSAQQPQSDPEEEHRSCERGSRPLPDLRPAPSAAH